MLENFTKTQKIIGAIVGLVFIGVLVFAVITIIYRAGKVAVTVKYAPFSATVTLDGERISNDSISYIVAGEYDLVVENEHFKTVSEKVTISDDYPYVIGQMTATSEEGERIARERQDEFLEVEGIFGGIRTDDGNKEKQQYPILKYLPINNALYSISYEYKNDKSLQINIKTTPTYQNTAIQKLYTLKGVVPTEYNIVFKDFVNPFDGSFVKNNESDPLNFLKNGYKNVLGDRYIVQNGQSEGNYFYTTIETSVGQEDGYFWSWRVLLVRSGGKWDFVTTPYPILTQHNTPNVETEILNKVNQL